MSFDFLFQPVEQIDAWLEGLFAGAPLVVALLIALVLGLRHASDPDHLVAVTSLVAVDGGDVRGAARLGAWWGAGHAAALLRHRDPADPVQVFGAGLDRAGRRNRGRRRDPPARTADRRQVGPRGLPGREAPAPAPGASEAHRHLHHRDRPEHRHRNVRTPRQALGIGLLHGLAGTGAVALLLIAALPGKVEAAAALAVFAPMSAVSMTLCTAAFAWLLTRPLIDPLYRTVLIPGFGVFGLFFGAWYVGIG